MEFAIDHGTLLGQWFKALADLKNTLRTELKSIQEIYDKTEAGQGLKRAMRQH